MQLHQMDGKGANLVSAYKIFYKYEMHRLGNRIKVTDCDIIWADTANPLLIQ